MSAYTPQAGDTVTDPSIRNRTIQVTAVGTESFLGIASWSGEPNAYEDQYPLDCGWVKVEPTIDAVAAEHLLHLTFTERFGMDWRLECVHAHDDERWFPTPADGLNDYDAACCWTISWFEEDGIECVVAEWPEPISFPALVHCWWDNEALKIEPARRVAAGGTAPTDPKEAKP